MLVTQYHSSTGNVADTLAHAAFSGNPFTTFDTDEAYHQVPSAPPESDESYLPGFQKGFLGKKNRDVRNE